MSLIFLCLEFLHFWYIFLMILKYCHVCFDTALNGGDLLVM